MINLNTPRTSKLKNFCSITSSKRIYASDYVTEGIPFVRGKEVVQQFKSHEKLQSELFIDSNKFEAIRDRFGAPSKGDMLITSVGTLGVPYLVKDEEDFYFKDGNLIWFKDFSGLCSKFFYYWIQSPRGRAQLQKCTIGTSQSAYTIERLKEIDLDILSHGQQEKIATFLSKYDNLIENNRRRIQLLEESARLLYKEWFVRLRFPGHEHVKVVDGVPEGWEKKTLGEVAPLSYGKALKKDLRTPGPFPVYGSSGDVGSHNKALVKGPGIILGRKGNVGSVFWSSKDFFPIDTVYFLSNDKASLYLYYVLMHMSFINTDVAVPGLNRDFAHSREMLIPDDKILLLFNDQATSIHSQIDCLKDYNMSLSQARDLLLPKLMNGEISI